MGDFYKSYLTWDALPSTFKSGIQPYIGATTIPTDANAQVAEFVNLCAKQIMTRYEFLNADFEKFHRGALPVGGFIQDTYMPRINCRTKTGVSDSGADIASALLSPAVASPDVGYFKLNPAYAYKITTEEDVTKEAFISEQAMADYIAKTLATPFESLKADRYANFKHFLQQIIGEVATENENFEGDITITGAFTPTGYDASAQALALQFILAVKNLAASFEYDSIKYNAAGVVTNSHKQPLTVFMKSAVKKSVEVLIASGAYNMANVDLKNFEIIEIDDLGDSVVTEGATTTTTTVGAIILDNRAIHWYTSYERAGAFYNPENGMTNSFLSAKDLLGYARWANVGRVKFVATT